MPPHPSSIKSPLVLVDFDGVIVRNRRASTYVKTRIESFVSKATGIKDPAQVSRLNEQLYTAHGHTLAGLRRHEFDASLADFNSHVYGNPKEYAGIGLEEEELMAWVSFYLPLKERGYDVKLFSNSSTRWMTHFIKHDPELFDFHDHLESFQGSPIYDRLLKPGRDVYDMVTQRYPRSTYVFIDDHIANFAYVNEDPRWINMWYSQPTQKASPINRSTYAVGSLGDAKRLLLGSP